MKRIIVSGYFTKLSGGHLDLIEEARDMGDYLIVIVNNDKQQQLKKGKIVLSEIDRVRLMNNLKRVDEVVLSQDDELAIVHTLKTVAERYPNDELVFANGGDRDSVDEVPESEVCEHYHIAMVYGVGESIRGLKKQ